MSIESLRGFQKGGTISLRPYRSQDSALLRETIQAIGETVLGWGLQSWEEAYEHPTGLSWTAEMEAEPVGFASTQDFGNRVTVFHSDLVRPAMQRRGVGTALVLLRLATIDPRDFDHVAVLATEYSASFYRRFGFIVHGEPNFDPFFKLTLFRMVLRFDANTRDSARRLLIYEKVQIPLE